MKKFLLSMIAVLFTALSASATINFTCNPAAGSTVESLKKVVLTFPDYYGATFSDDYAMYDNAIKNEAGEFLPSQGSLTWGPDETKYNEVTWEYGGSKITEAGTYTIVIPAGAITLAEDETADPVPTTEDITFTLTVGAATDPVLQSTWPQANTTVNELPDYVTFNFNQEVQQPYSCAIQLGENNPITIDPSNITVLDAVTVKFTLTEQVKAQLGKGGITAYVWLKKDSQHYDTYFTVADAFAVESSSFTATGGQVVFNENCDFVDPDKTTCYVSSVKTKDIATQATLALDNENFAAVNATFAETLGDGDYTLDIPEGMIKSTSEEPLASVKVAFTVTGGVAQFVSNTPQEGSDVDLDTEYVLTFSKPVKFTSALSDITIGENPFASGDGATFSQNEDKTEIHAKLDKSTLEMYGVKTKEEAVTKFGSTLKLHVYGVKDETTGEKIEGNDPDEDNQFTFAYSLGKPAVKVELNGENGTTVEKLETVYFSNPEGIVVADESKKLYVVGAKTKDIVYTAKASDLEYVPGELDAAGYYVMTLDEPLAKSGDYMVQVPAGVFKLAGKALNEDTELAFTVDAPAQSYSVNFYSEGADEMCDMWKVRADGVELEYPYEEAPKFVEGTKISVGGMCIEGLHKMVVTVNDAEVPESSFDPDTKYYTFTLNEDANIKVLFREPVSYKLNFYAEGADEMCDSWAVQVDGKKLEYPYDNDNPYTFEEGTKVSVGGICQEALHELHVYVNGMEVQNTEGEHGAFQYSFTLAKDTEVKFVFSQNFTLDYSATLLDEMCDGWKIQVDGKQLEYPYEEAPQFKEGAKVTVAGMCTDSEADHVMVVKVNGEQVQNTEGEYGAFQYSFTLAQDTKVEVSFVYPQLQQTYPQANTKVTEIPDSVIFMFDNEVRYVYQAAIQSGENEPVVISGDKCTVKDGNSVYVDVTAVKDKMEKGKNVTVYLQLSDDQQYETNFTYADEFGVVASEFTAKGGKLTFSENVDFAEEGAETVKCYVSTVKTKAIATQATLTLDEEEFNVVNVEFADSLAEGTYTLDIQDGAFKSVAGEPLASVKVQFVVANVEIHADVTEESVTTPEGITKEEAAEAVENAVNNNTAVTQVETGVEAAVSTEGIEFTDESGKKVEIPDGTPVTVSLSINYESAVVSNEEGAVVTEMTFDIKPVASVVVDGQEYSTNVGNDNVKGTVTLRLPVDKNADYGYANVKHEGTYFVQCPVQTAENGDKYIELQVTSFSKYSYALSNVVDDINAVAAVANASEAHYNLAGQRVNANAKGIVIVNGKKVLK